MLITLVDRYIARSVALNILVVLFVLTGLFLFFTLVEEAGDIGTGDYDAFAAMQYVLLQAPTSIYELFPVAVLLGALVGLGALANNSELTVLRAAGISVGRLVWAVVKLVLLLLVIVMLVEDRIAPGAMQYAKNMRSIKKSGQIALQSGRSFWLRDGDRFIHIRELRPDGKLGEMSVYDFDAERRLHSMTHAQTAYYQNAEWVLENLRQTKVYAEHSEIHSTPRAVWNSTLSPELLNILVLKPEDLALPELYQYIGYLKANRQRAAPYELALWLKLVYPFSSVVMVLLAVPFVFGSMRSVSIGQRILLGTLLGIGFFVLNKTATHVGLLYNLPPWLSAVLPTLVFFGAALVLIRSKVT